MMNYAKFKEEIAAMIAADESLGLNSGLISSHYCGEHGTDERSKEWILRTNLKYYQKESDMLLGDFLEITSPEDEKISSRFEMKYLYDEYTKNGWSKIGEIITKNMEIFHAYAGQIDDIEDFKMMKDRLIIRPLNYPALRKSGETKDTVYRVYGDIALVLYFLINENDVDYLTAKVPESTMKLWGLPEDVVWQTAMMNTMTDALPRLYVKQLDIPYTPPQKKVGSPEYLRGAFMSATDPGNYQITPYAAPTLTTTRQLNGAVAFFYPGVQERLAEIVGGDFYIAFTSICESHIHPVSNRISPKDILDCLKSMNKAFPKILLSNKVFLYHKEEKLLESLNL